MTVVFADPGPGTLGRVDYSAATITLHPRLLQGERRATLTHELIHLERGPAADGCEALEEHMVELEAARRLITIAELVRAIQWTDDVHELALELWVDPATVRVRMRHLDDEHRRLLTKVRASRDGVVGGGGEDPVSQEEPA